MTRARLALAFAIAALPAACSLTLPFDDLTSDGPPPHASTPPPGSSADADPDAPDAPDLPDVPDAPDASDDVVDADADAPTDADASTCTDKQLDGDETDVDCGGVTCPHCGSGKKCKAGTDCNSGVCESGKCAPCPLGMVRVPLGMQFYCIDATEVTVSAYLEFATKTTPKDVTLPAVCKWKDTFMPASVDANPVTPVRQVDWCDAYAYCDSLGKRLCGGFASGSSKPAVAFDKFDDPNVSQWRHACSYGTSPVWPYGPTAQPTKCATDDNKPDGGSAKVVAVHSLPLCIGASPELNGLYDMSGNVAEWEDSCSGSSGAPDTCRVRGGSFHEKASAASCGSPATRNRNERVDWVGIRCCRF